MGLLLVPSHHLNASTHRHLRLNTEMLSSCLATALDSDESPPC
jgi:hypothetical protein